MLVLVKVELFINGITSISFYKVKYLKSLAMTDPIQMT